MSPYTAFDYNSVGSKFFIELPITEPPQSTTEIQKVELKKEPDTKSLSSFTVLYIDDIPNNIELVRKTLSMRDNIKFLSSLQASLGIDIAKSQKVDLILMDIQMPEIDGVEAFKILQKDERTSDIPVIALSANALTKDVDKVLDVGFKSYITKPIDIPKFLEEMDKFIEEEMKR